MLLRSRTRNTQFQAREAGAARVRGISQQARLDLVGRFGGARATAREAFLDQMNEANLQKNLDQRNLASDFAGRFGALPLSATPQNQKLMQTLSSALAGGDIGAAVAATDKLKFGAGKVEFQGSELDIMGDSRKKLQEFAENLKNSAKLLEINANAQEDFIKAQKKMADLMSKNGPLIAGIEGFKNSLQSALQSIADPSMSASKIGMNLLMGTLGSINQQASGQVADFVGGKLGQFFGIGTPDKGQRGMYISGSRTGDKNPAMLEDGEYVLNRNAVKAMGGPGALDSINFGMFPRFQNGGVFGGVPSKHRRKALDKFGHASFGPSGGGSAAGGGGIGLNLGIFDPNLSSLAHASDPTLQATRGFLRQERQKDIQKQFQKQAERDQLVQTIVGTAINVGLSKVVGKFSGKVKEDFAPDQSLIDTAAGYGHGDQSPGISDLPAPGYKIPSLPFTGRQGTPMDPKFTGTASANRAIRMSDQHFAVGKNLASGMSMNKAVAKSDAHGGRAGALMNTFRKAGIKPGDRAAMAQHMYNEALNVGGKYGVIPLPEHRGLGGLGVHQRFEQAVEKQVDDTVLQYLSEGMIGTAAGYGHGNQAPGKRMGHTNQGIINMLNKGKSLHDDIINQNKVGPVTPYEFRKNRKAPVKDKYGNVIIPYQRGGSIDNIPAMLTGGEFVVNAGAVRKYGSNMLNGMNRFQSGGMVGNQKFIPQEGSAKSSDASSSTNNNTVNIAVNMGATGPTVSEDASGTNNDSQSNGRDLGRKIRRAVLEVIEHEKRVGGNLRDPYAKA